MSAQIEQVAALGRRIAEQGIDADPVSLLLLAHTARDLEVSDVALQVMVDDAEPVAARVRAFARVSSEVARRLQAAPVPRFRIEAPAQSVVP